MSGFTSMGDLYIMLTYMYTAFDYPAIATGLDVINCYGESFTLTKVHLFPASPRHDQYETVLAEFRMVEHHFGPSKCRSSVLSSTSNHTFSNESASAY